MKIFDSRCSSSCLKVVEQLTCAPRTAWPGRHGRSGSISRRGPSTKIPSILPVSLVQLHHRHLTWSCSGSREPVWVHCGGRCPPLITCTQQRARYFMRACNQTKALNCVHGCTPGNSLHGMLKYDCWSFVSLEFVLIEFYPTARAIDLNGRFPHTVSYHTVGPHMAHGPATLVCQSHRHRRAPRPSRRRLM